MLALCLGPVALENAVVSLYSKSVTKRVCGVQLFTAQKPIKQVRWVERKAYFLSDPGNCMEGGGAEQTFVQRLTPHHWQPVGQELLHSEGGGYM